MNAAPAYMRSPRSDLARSARWAPVLRSRSMPSRRNSLSVKHLVFSHVLLRPAAIAGGSELRDNAFKFMRCTGAKEGCGVSNELVAVLKRAFRVTAEKYLQLRSAFYGIKMAESLEQYLVKIGRAVRLQTHDRDSRRLSAKNLGIRDQPPSGDSLWVKAFCLSDGDRTRAHCLSWRGDDIGLIYSTVL